MGHGNSFWAAEPVESLPALYKSQGIGPRVLALVLCFFGVGERLVMGKDMFFITQSLNVRTGGSMSL